MNERIWFFCLTVLKTNLFVRFLEEFEDTKKSFWNYLTFSELKKQIVKPNYSCKLKLKISAKTKYKLLNLNEGMTFWLKTSCWSFERISSKTRYQELPILSNFMLLNPWLWNSSKLIWVNRHICSLLETLET